MKQNADCIKWCFNRACHLHNDTYIIVNCFLRRLTLLLLVITISTLKTHKLSKLYVLEFS